MTSLRETAVCVFIFILFMFILMDADNFLKCDCYDKGFFNLNRIFQWQIISHFIVTVSCCWIFVLLLSYTRIRSVFPALPFHFYLCASTHLVHLQMYMDNSFHLRPLFMIFKINATISSFYIAYCAKPMINNFCHAILRMFTSAEKVEQLQPVTLEGNKINKINLEVRNFIKTVNKYLDRDLILHSTLIQLSTIFDLQNGCLWSLNEDGSKLLCTCNLSGKNMESIPTEPLDIGNLTTGMGPKVLGPDSIIGERSKINESGIAIAMRFQVSQDFIVLVLVRKFWRWEEVDILQDVIDEVSDALSRVEMIRETKIIQEELAKRRPLMNPYKKDVTMANQATARVQNVLSTQMKKPMCIISSLLPEIQKGIDNEKHESIVELMNSWIHFRQAASVLVETTGQLEPFKPLFSKINVLLVDGDINSKQITRGMLELLGCNVTCISSGYDCLGPLGGGEKKFHVIFLEINISDINGFDVARIVRDSHKRWPLIIALNSKAEAEERYAQVGIDAVLHKPIRLHWLLDILLRLLQLTDSITEEEVPLYVSSSGYSGDIDSF